jgi:hypothetical protein
LSGWLVEDFEIILKGWPIFAQRFETGTPEPEVVLAGQQCSYLLQDVLTQVSYGT